MPNNYDQIPIANASEAENSYGQETNLYLFSFGAYADTKVYVWADSAEKGLEEAVDWLREKEPSHSIFVKEDEIRELMDEVREELPPGTSEDEIQEQALADITVMGDGTHITSYEWFVDDVYDESEYEDVLERSLGQDDYPYTNASTKKGNKKMAAGEQWKPGFHGDLKEFLEKAVFLRGGEGTINLDDEDPVHIGIVFSVESYGPHAAAIAVDQNRYHASPDTSLQTAHEILEDYWNQNYQEHYDELVKDHGQKNVDDYGMFTETFDGATWTLTPQEAAAAIEGTEAAQYIDIYYPEEEEEDLY